MRSKAGRPCLSEGLWFTPAKAGSQWHFKLGDLIRRQQHPQGGDVVQFHGTPAIDPLNYEQK